ncbi:MAG TPA: peptidylprolyl isomerase, partial [Candidatus Caenarcaniphilales bacterium]
WLARYGLSREQLEVLATRELRLEKFKQATWGHKLEAYFLRRKGQLDRAIYSLIRTKDKGIVRELYFRIQEGEQSFAELARQHSQGQEANTGGLLGPMPLSQLHPAIAKILASSQPGQLRPPTRVEGWFLILRLEKFIPARLDEPMRRRMLDELFESWLGEQLQQVHPLSTGTSAAPA